MLRLLLGRPFSAVRLVRRLADTAAASKSQASHAGKGAVSASEAPAQAAAAAAAAVDTASTSTPTPVESDKPTLASLPEGKYILIGDDERKTLFPEGLAGDALVEFSATSKPSFFVRSYTREIASSLHKLEEQKIKEQKGFVLTGPPGTGKSHALNTLVYHFRRRGWFVLFVSDATRYTDGSVDWTPDPARPGFYLQPDPAAATVQFTAMGNEAILRQVPATALGKDLSWLTSPPRGYFPDEEPEINIALDDEERLQASEEHTAAKASASAEEPRRGDPLRPPRRPVIEPIVVPDVDPGRVQTAYDVLCAAAHRRYSAPYAFDAVCDYLSRQTEAPVLVAIDGFNKLYDLSEYRDEKLQRIPAPRMSMCRRLTQLVEEGLEHGAVVGAMSARLPTTQRVPVRKLRELGYKGVSVRGYNRDETKTVLDWYHSTGVIEKRITGQGIDRMVMLHSGVGRHILFHAMTM